MCQRNPFLEAVTAGSHIVLLGALGMHNGMREKQTEPNRNFTIPEKEKENTEGMVPFDLLGTARLPAPSPPNIFVNISKPALLAIPANAATVQTHN